MKVQLTAFSQKLKSEIFEIDNEIGEVIYILIDLDGPRIVFDLDKDSNLKMKGIFRYSNEIDGIRMYSLEEVKSN